MQIMRDSYGFTSRQSCSTFDCYKRSLELNGFIENVSNSLGKPGFYMKLYDIPEDLSSTECTKRAYNNNPICRNKTSIFEEII